MKTALVLGGTNAHIPLIKNLKKRGFYTVLIDYHENPIAKKTADLHLRESAMDTKAVLQIAIERQVKLVISTCSDQLNATACYVAEELGLPAPYSYQTALNVTHKFFMKEKMREKGIPTAKYICIKSESELENHGLNLPVVIKPVDGCGSKGVRKAHNPAELKSYLKEALNLSRDKKAIVEEFQTGREICVDCYIQDTRPHIISIYEKFNLISRETVIQCFRSIRPVKISAQAEANIQTIIREIAQIFNLDHTAFFIQTIVQDDQVSVIEFAARIAGGLAYRATELVSGFDAVNASIDSFFQQKSRLKFNSSSEYYTTNSIYGSPGIFGRVSGYQQLLKNGIIEEFCHYKTKGMQLDSELASKDRVAGFIVKDQNKDILFEKTEMALSVLEIYDIEDKPIMYKNIFQGVKDQNIFIDTLLN